ncbi:hypothetical protein V5799_031169 [Amblyomma americanum]|uniref:Secreted protein n=1 Tax=Amblyomma americanum TaxID=6943 RepID=A0AAQ4EL14_AMBAM
MYYQISVAASCWLLVYYHGCIAWRHPATMHMVLAACFYQLDTPLHISRYSLRRSACALMGDWNIHIAKASIGAKF